MQTPIRLVSREQPDLTKMHTLIRLLLGEQADLGVHCLVRPVCSNTVDCYGTVQIQKGAPNIFVVILKSNTSCTGGFVI